MPLSDAPLELLEIILAFLVPTEIFHARRVCTAMYAGAMAEPLWRALIEASDFRDDAEQFGSMPAARAYFAACDRHSESVAFLRSWKANDNTSSSLFGTLSAPGTPSAAFDRKRDDATGGDGASGDAPPPPIPLPVPNIVPLELMRALSKLPRGKGTAPYVVARLLGEESLRHSLGRLQSELGRTKRGKALRVFLSAPFNPPVDVSRSSGPRATTVRLRLPAAASPSDRLILRALDRLRRDYASLQAENASLRAQNASLTAAVTRLSALVPSGEQRVRELQEEVAALRAAAEGTVTRDQLDAAIARAEHAETLAAAQKKRQHNIKRTLDREHQRATQHLVDAEKRSRQTRQSSLDAAVLAATEANARADVQTQLADARRAVTAGLSASLAETQRVAQRTAAELRLEQEQNEELRAETQRVAQRTAAKLRFEQERNEELRASVAALTSALQYAEDMTGMEIPKLIAQNVSSEAAGEAMRETVIDSYVDEALEQGADGSPRKKRITSANVRLRPGEEIRLPPANASGRGRGPAVRGATIATEEIVGRSQMFRRVNEYDACLAAISAGNRSALLDAHRTRHAKEYSEIGMRSRRLSVRPAEKSSSLPTFSYL